MSRVTRKDLEGRFFVFEFGADYTIGTSALAVFQVKNGCLEERRNPCEIDSPFGEWEFESSGGVEDQMTRDYLVQQGVKEVFSLKNPYQERFLGRKLSWRYGKNDYGGYTPLSDDFFWAPFFREAGIKLRFYDSRTRRILESSN